MVNFVSGSIWHSLAEHLVERGVQHVGLCGQEPIAAVVGGAEQQPKDICHVSYKGWEVAWHRGSILASLPAAAMV